MIFHIIPVLPDLGSPQYLLQGTTGACKRHVESGPEWLPQAKMSDLPILELRTCAIAIHSIVVFYSHL
jgi:hypothetical protein